MVRVTLPPWLQKAVLQNGEHSIIIERYRDLPRLTPARGPCPALGERDVEDLRVGLAMAAAPLLDGADAVLVVEDLIRDAGIGRRHPQREVILDHPAIAARHHESRLMHVEVVVLSRELDQFPGLRYRRLTWSERQADRRYRRIKLCELIRGRFLRPWHHFSILIELLVAESKRVVGRDVREAEEDAPMMALRQRYAPCRRRGRGHPWNRGAEDTAGLAEDARRIRGAADHDLVAG